MKNAILIASRENPLHLLEKELQQRGMETTLLFREDLNSAALLQQAAEKLPAPDCLIISALCDKKYEGKNLAELSTEEYKQWKYYSLIQFYEINAAFIGKMVANGGGKLLGIVSEAGVIPTKNECMNGGAGAALVMGIRCVAEESHEDGIYANAVAIGSVEPNDDFKATVDDAETVLHLPGKKLLSPETAMKRVADILDMTGELLSGNVLTLDGAFSCAYMREW